MIRCFSFTLLASWLSIVPVHASEKDITFGLTTTQEASGLSRALVEGLSAAFPNKEFSYTVSGTSQLLRSLQDGFVPFGITHHAGKEASLVARKGHQRIPVFANDFLFVGPKSNDFDCDTIAKCLEALHASEEVFLSRGDQSGTHAFELEKWEKIGVDPMLMANYQVASGGAANSLRLCSVRGCYLIIDESSFAARPNEDLVEIARDEATNIYSLIYSVEFARNGGADVIEWLRTKAPEISAEFGYRAQ